MLDPTIRTEILNESINRINTSIRSGEDVLLFTSRQVVAGADSRQSLEISRTVSNCLIEIVRKLDVRPRFFIAKGGITSSDIATQGLNVTRAEVMGQILPGIPVWQLGADSKYPGLPYVVFPGNVGSESALLDIYKKLVVEKNKK